MPPDVQETVPVPQPDGSVLYEACPPAPRCWMEASAQALASAAREVVIRFPNEAYTFGLTTACVIVACWLFDRTTRKRT